MLTQKTSKILQWTIRFCLAVVLVVPVIVHSNFFFPFIVPKNLAFRLLVEIAFFSYLALAYIDTKYRPRFSLLTNLVLAFLGISIISSIFGINPIKSIWGNYERMGGLIHLTHLTAYFFVLVQLLKEKKDWHGLFSVSIFVSVVMTIIGLAQYLGTSFILASSGGSRLAGTAGNPTFLAAYLIFHLFLLLYFWSKEERFNITRFGLGFAVLNGYLIVSQLLSVLFIDAHWGFWNFLKIGVIGAAKAEPAFLIGYIVFQLFILAAWWWRKRPNIIRIFLSFLFVVEFFIFFQTQTRGALLGFWAILPPLFLVLYYVFKTDKIKSIIFATLGAVTLMSQLAIGQYGKLIANALAHSSSEVFSSLSGSISRMAGISSYLTFYISIFLISLISIYFFKKNKTMRWMWLGGLLILIIAPLAYNNNVGQFTGFLKSDATIEEFFGRRMNDITTESRILNWRASFQGWVEHPKTFLIGLGPENYSHAFNKRFPVEIFRDPGSQIWFDRAHNIFFDIALTTGLFGLIIFGSIMVVAGRNFIRGWQSGWGVSGSWLLVGLIVAYLLQNLFVFDTLNTEVILYLFLGFAAFAGSSAATHKTQTENNEQNRFLTQPVHVYGAVCVCLLAFVLLGSTTNAKIAQSNRQLFQALVNRNQPVESTGVTVLQHFQNSLQGSVTGRYEAREQLSSYVTQLLPQRNQENPQYVTDSLNFAIIQLRTSIEEDPKNVRHYLWLANLYNTVGRRQQQFASLAQETISDGLLLSPTRPQLYFTRGESNLILGDAQAAVKDFQKAVALAPDVVASQLKLFTLYAVLGQQSEAQSSLETIRQLRGGDLVVSDYNQILRAYSLAKNFDQLIAIYQEIIENEPNNQSAHLGLAQALAAVGQIDQAHMVLDKYSQIQPSAVKEIEELRSKINNGDFKQ